MTKGSNSDRLITVFGGSGFVGRHIVRALAQRGHRIRVAVRRPDLAGHLQPLGNVGQIHAVQANVRSRESIDRAVTGVWAVINLVGILAESGRQRFAAVHDKGAGAIAEAAAAAGAQHVVHMSAIGADPQSPSAYARTKAAGEAAVKAAFPGAVIIRPSIIFGPEDEFFNRFAAMARISPVVPLVGAKTRFQPVFVGDVAEAFLAAVEGRAKPGKIYELGGPEVATFRELMEKMLAIIERRRWIVSIPLPIAKFQAFFLQLLPKPPLTVDQVRQLARDNVVSEEATAAGRTLQGLGIGPRAMDAILPSYLYCFRKSGQFAHRRMV
ncbi:MAG: complex I NDUFA9 subunit family protein [Hyphomicrobiales bacterium]|nr:complex I NDUFA9 subunit family protein [Hyphomicrobiales bacterium]